ncbi:hypothetical protein KSF78_0009262 [Schistosoma japonicum]|nr:hypothetical protein KSF78_0009262 [Schistosoma japonicum]
MIRCNGFIYELLVIVFALSLQHITGKRYQPAYLATNKVGDDESTNTLRIVQERTTDMSFEWNKMYHEDFAHMTLGNDVKFDFDIAKDILNGEIGLLEVIGGPCEVVDYYAAGKYYWYLMTYEFQRYTMTYSLVPRITNVSIQTSSDLSSYVTWQHEASSSCKSSHTTIVFRGNSTQPLEMFTAERNEDKFYLTDVTDVSGGQQVLILFNRLGKHFSLPTIVKFEMNAKNVKHEASTIKPTAATTTLMQDVTTSSTTHLLILIGIIVSICLVPIVIYIFYKKTIIIID